MCTSDKKIDDPTHGVVIGFRDLMEMDQKHWGIFSYLDNKKDNYVNFTQATFEDIAGASGNDELSRLRLAVSQAGQNKLKIFLLGHGLAQREFIFSGTYLAREDAPAKKRTLPQLAGLVKDIVGVRCNSLLEAGKTRVVMLACVFGRSVTGDFKDSNAWELHKQLRNAKVFVELVARTEYVTLSHQGLAVGVNPDPWTREPSLGSIKTLGPGKRVPYTKVVCKYESGNPVIKMWDDKKHEHGTNEVEVKRIYWLHEALYRIGGHATDAEHNVNHKYLVNAVGAYINFVELGVRRDEPDYLYRLLSYLVGDSPDNPLAQAISHSGHGDRYDIQPIHHRKDRPHVLDPATARFLKGIVADYPKEPKH